MKRKTCRVIALFAALVIAAGCAAPEKTAMKEEERRFEEALKKALEKAADNVTKTIDTTATLPTVEEEPVLWQVEVESLTCDNISLLSPKRLLFKTGKIYHLVDQETGGVLWSFNTLDKGWSGPDSILLALKDLLLVRVDGDMTTVIAAIDPVQGKGLWSHEIRTTGVQFLSLLEAGRVVAVEREKRKVNFTAYDIHTGKKGWDKKYKMGWQSNHRHLPLAMPGEMWHFYGVVEKLSGRDGASAWKRTDIRLDEDSPRPQLKGGKGGILFIIDGENRLHLLDAGTGRTIMQAQLDRSIKYTSIYTAGENLYLRGNRRGQDKKTAYVLQAIDRKSGRMLWSYDDDEPSVSNFVEQGGTLYFSTPSSLVSLDIDSGRRLFKTHAADTGRTFPVRVRSYPGKIVYVGELVIAAFDSATGKRVYKHGMDPVSQKMVLSSLDLRIQRLEHKLEVLTRGQFFAGKGADYRLFGRQAELSQNLANKYSDLATQYRWGIGAGSGLSAEARYWKGAHAANRAQIESAFSGAFAQLDFFFAMKSLSDTMAAALQADDRKTLHNLRLLRSLIYSAYTSAEAGDYVFRPNREGDFVGVSIIHLPTGRTAWKKLFPRCTTWKCEDYGMWALVDIKEGVIYYQGLRMAPVEDQIKGSEKRLYNTYLIAQEVELPR